MTVTYTHEVSHCKGLGCFWKLLFRWKGSIYKLIWPDLIMYTILYFILSLVYRMALDEVGKRNFEMVSLYCQYFSDLIPLSFVLGFYVNIVIQRWWAQYESLPWPDSLSLYVSTAIQGQDDRSRMMRRTIVRYANLASTMTLKMVCLGVKRRFPTYEYFVDAGLMEANEKKVIETMESKSPHVLYWMPLVWACSIVTRARRENKIKDDFAVKTIIDEINKMRSNLGGLLSYDWISIPLVYTQVVTLAVYIFFLSTLMGRQFLDPEKKYDKQMIDFYVPIFTYLQFFFYMGWLKVAETLVNPFGDDDDDFEVNWLIDRNVQIAYMIVDEMHNEHPDMIEDMYWDKVFPQQLPYTVASEGCRKEPPVCSTDHFTIPEVETGTDRDSLRAKDRRHSQLFGSKQSGYLCRTGNSILNGNIRLLGRRLSSATVSRRGSVQTEPKLSTVQDQEGTLGTKGLSIFPQTMDNDSLSAIRFPKKEKEDVKTTTKGPLNYTINESDPKLYNKDSGTSAVSPLGVISSHGSGEPNLNLNDYHTQTTPKNSYEPRHEITSTVKMKPQEEDSPSVLNPDNRTGGFTNGSFSLMENDTQNHRQRTNTYFPIFDKPTKYLWSNVAPKVTQGPVKDSGLLSSENENQRLFTVFSKDLENKEDSRTRNSAGTDSKNSDSIEFWF